jgi:hypothetical protein
MKRALLENAYNNKILVGTRTNSQEWDESIIGFITHLEDVFFTINEIDEYGMLIGNTVIAFDDVINVEIKDRYQKRLKFVYDHNSKLKPNKRITIWKDGKELLPHIKLLIKDKKIATLYFNEVDFVTGFILENDEDYVLIKNVGNEGDEDGTSLHQIERLVGLRYDSLEEQKINMLFQNRQTFYKN